MVSSSSPTAVVGFVDWNYRHKTVSTKVLQDAVSVSIPYIGQKFIPTGNRTCAALQNESSKHMSETALPRGRHLTRAINNNIRHLRRIIDNIISPLALQPIEGQGILIDCLPHVQQVGYPAGIRVIQFLTNAKPIKSTLSLTV